MAEPSFDESAAHRWFAVELNNAAWDWLEAAECDGSAADEVLHAAHASCYHWLQVGGPANQVRGECLVANVHAAIGDGAGAVRHARRCVELAEAHAAELFDWDWAFALDALARAHAASADTRQAALARTQAREFGDKIADDQDKVFFERWHRAGNWHGLADED